MAKSRDVSDDVGACRPPTALAVGLRRPAKSICQCQRTLHLNANFCSLGPAGSCIELRETGHLHGRGYRFAQPVGRGSRQTDNAPIHGRGRSNWILADAWVGLLSLPLGVTSVWRSRADALMKHLAKPDIIATPLEGVTSCGWVLTDSGLGLNPRRPDRNSVEEVSRYLARLPGFDVEPLQRTWLMVSVMVLSLRG